MTFEEWYKKSFNEDVANHFSDCHLKEAWNAAIHESHLIAWETYSHPDDIAEDIRKLEAK